MSQALTRPFRGQVNINTMCELGSGGVSLTSMARRTLGVAGTRAASATYLFLHYALLVACALAPHPQGCSTGDLYHSPSRADRRNSIRDVHLRPEEICACLLRTNDVISHTNYHAVAPSLLEPGIIAARLGSRSAVVESSFVDMQTRRRRGL